MSMMDLHHMMEGQHYKSIPKPDLPPHQTFVGILSFADQNEVVSTYTFDPLFIKGFVTRTFFQVVLRQTIIPLAAHWVRP